MLQLTFALLVWLSVAPCCVAAALQIGVYDPDGRGVPDAVLVATSLSSSMPAVKASAAAVMDQLNKAFVPEVLVVRAGTTVIFPNSDSVAHQVYSFSPAKRFELPLYRGQPHAPVLFDQSGVVVLGCNIHDSMVGYIYVTDSPYFVKTGPNGDAILGPLPPGRYKLTAWSARISAQPPEQTIMVTEAPEQSIKFRVQEKVRPRTEAPKAKRLRDY
jgi:plastocyanin